MKDISEREKKLVNYIVFLISILNIYTMIIASIYKNFEWMENGFVNLKMKATEDEMIKYLNDEYEVGMGVVIDKEVVK